MNLMDMLIDEVINLLVCLFVGWLVCLYKSTMTSYIDNTDVPFMPVNISICAQL